MNSQNNKIFMITKQGKHGMKRKKERKKERGKNKQTRNNQRINLLQLFNVLQALQVCLLLPCHARTDLEGEKSVWNLVKERFSSSI